MSNKPKVVDHAEQSKPEPPADPRAEECFAWRVRFLMFVDKAANLRALTSEDSAELDALLADGERLRFAPKNVPGTFNFDAWGRFEAALLAYANKLRSSSRVELSTGGGLYIPSLEAHDSVRAAFAREGNAAAALLDAALAEIQRLSQRRRSFLDRQNDLLTHAFAEGSDVLNSALALLADAREELREREAAWAELRRSDDVRARNAAFARRGQSLDTVALVNRLLDHLRRTEQPGGVDISELSTAAVGELLAADQRPAAPPEGDAS
ncbi:MAG: hypothetical protein ACSLFQ_01500 [Thermoanaerobaculia bacterium]